RRPGAHPRGRRRSVRLPRRSRARTSVCPVGGGQVPYSAGELQVLGRDGAARAVGVHGQGHRVVAEGEVGVVVEFLLHLGDVDDHRGGGEVRGEPVGAGEPVPVEGPARQVGEAVLDLLRRQRFDGHGVLLRWSGPRSRPHGGLAPQPATGCGYGPAGPRPAARGGGRSANVTRMATVPPGTRTPSPSPSAAGGAGPLLRAWRAQRRGSQLEVALRAGSSARHISFVETGRARPSEEMVLRLAEHLDVPVRERNALLLAAGYAPRFPETPLDDPALGALREGIEQLIGGFEPYPALVVNALYDVVAASAGVLDRLAGGPEALLGPPLNTRRLPLRPRGLAPRMRTLRQWRGHLLAQMERHIARRRSAPLRALYEEVAASPVPGSAGED